MKEMKVEFEKVREKFKREVEDRIPLKPTAYKKSSSMKDGKAITTYKPKVAENILFEDNTIHFSLINDFLEIEKKLCLSENQVRFCNTYFKTLDYERAVKESEIEEEELKNINTDEGAIRYMQLLQMNRKKIFQEKSKRSYHWKVELLETMMNNVTVDDDGSLVFDEMTLKAMSEHNKMLGHYAPEKHINANVNAEVSMERMSNIVDDLIKKHEKDY